MADQWAYSDLLEPGHGYREVSIDYDRAVREYCKVIAQLWREVSFEGHKTASSLAAAYDAQNATRIERVQRKLTEKQREHQRAVANFAKARTDRQRDVLQGIVDRLETEIISIEEEAIPLTRRLNETRERVEQFAGRLVKVREVVLGDRDCEGRKKAAKLREVIRSFLAIHI